VSLNTEIENTSSAQSRRQNNWLVWLVKSSLAVFEQALIAGSNFLLNVLVARWLTAEQYGAYAVAFAVYMLLVSLYQGLILEPMSVLSASLDEERFRSYLGSLLRVQVRISAVLTITLAVFVLGLFATRPHNLIASPLLALVVSLPFILVFWLLRGACYVKRSPQYATQGAFIYSVVMLGGLMVVRHWFQMSGFTVFIGMGVSAAAVSCLLLTRLRPNFQSAISDREQWIEHWNFGRWELSKIGFDWISQNISYTLTAGFLGMAQVGALKAIMTVFLPLTQSMAALRRLILPHLATVSDRDGHRGTADSVRNMVVIYVVGGLVYGILVSLAAKPLFRLLYAGKFMEFTYLVPWAAVGLLFGLPAHVIDMGLRAIRSPKSIFLSSCLSALACVCVTVPLTWAFGIRGAICSIIISTAILLVILSIIFRHKSRAAAEQEPLALGISS
jgi:O-antigen/teichoic acid export membrane protein